MRRQVAVRTARRRATNPREFRYALLASNVLPSEAVPEWTFLSDYAHVLVLLARGPRTEPETLATELRVGLDIIEPVLDDLEEADTSTVSVRVESSTPTSIATSHCATRSRSNTPLAS